MCERGAGLRSGTVLEDLREALPAHFGFNPASEAISDALSFHAAVLEAALVIPQRGCWLLGTEPISHPGASFHRGRRSGAAGVWRCRSSGAHLRLGGCGGAAVGGHQDPGIEALASICGD